MKTWFPAFLIAVVLILAQGVAGAEQAAKVPRIGYLGVNGPSQDERHRSPTSIYAGRNERNYDDSNCNDFSGRSSS